MIQRFEYTFELAWNTIKDLLESQGFTGILGSRNAIQIAFERGLVENGEMWMEMIESRIKSSHIYDESTAIKIAVRVQQKYYFLIQDLISRLDREASDDAD